MRRALLTPAVLAASVLVCRPSSAFCRTTTCPDCPSDSNGCTIGGAPISWPQACVSFSVQKDGSRIADYPLVNQLVRSAFASWQGTRCGATGDAPSIYLADQFGAVLCSEHEYNVGRANANAIVFHDDVWPYDQNAQATLALTTVTFDKNTGDIYDADLEVNGTQPLSTDTPVPLDKFDLRSILTHETGHFLGLAHSLDSGSAMRASYLPGDDSFRALGSDDQAAICEIYRPDYPITSCDFTPRYGFSPDCALRTNAGKGCALSPLGTPAATGHGACLLGCLAAFFLARRPRRRRFAS